MSPVILWQTVDRVFFNNIVPQVEGSHNECKYCQGLSVQAIAYGLIFLGLFSSLIPDEFQDTVLDKGHFLLHSFCFCKRDHTL
jgi:hypothetical protein